MADDKKHTWEGKKNKRESKKGDTSSGNSDKKKKGSQDEAAGHVWRVNENTTDSFNKDAQK